MSHAVQALCDRAPNVDAWFAVRDMRRKYHEGALPLVTPSVFRHRSIYRYDTDFGPLYPLIANDGYVVTVFLRDMLVHTPRGRELLADLDEAAA